jgi:anthranilate phosphoribosyltransferase
MIDLRSYVDRLMRREDLSRAEAGELLDSLLNGNATDAQVAAVLVALKAKGESIDELAGLAEGIRSRSVRISCRHEVFIDTAGTGSSCAKTFNVSTAAAFVIAGAGLPVAKHGNRAASSRCGSADVLGALGVNVSVSAEVSEQCLNEVGICFMFAPLYHSATARVAAIRRELGIQTTFNLLGPLTNPARAPRQLIGVSDRRLIERLAGALSLLGVERAWVVHGEDGLDEVTISGNTLVNEVSPQGMRSFEIKPEDFEIKRADLRAIGGGDAEANAKIIRDVLSGKRRDGARDLVLINAAAALYIGDLATQYGEAAKLASQSIDSGAAYEKLEQLIRATTMEGRSG